MIKLTKIINQKITVLGLFKSYCSMADWLENNTQYFNESYLYAHRLGIRKLNAIRRVTFDNHGVFVEGRGQI